MNIVAEKKLQAFMKLDAGQRPMLARPAAPLAACVQQNLIAMVTSID